MAAPESGQHQSRVLITGGHGFVGLHLAGVLIERGYEVTILDLRPGLTPAGAFYIRADLTDYDQVRRAIRTEQDLIVHLAGSAAGRRSVLDPLSDFRANPLGSANLMTRSLEVGVQRFLYLSTASVYGVPEVIPITEENGLRPILPYGANKLAAEFLGMALWRSRQLPFMVARSFNLYGPGENAGRAEGEIPRFIRQGLRGERVDVVGDPEIKSRDFIHVQDLVEGLAVVAEHGSEGEIYNLGSGKETTLAKLITTIEGALGSSLNTVKTKGVSNETYRAVADITKARSLGFEPKVGFSAGVTSLVAHLRNEV